MVVFIPLPVGPLQHVLHLRFQKDQHLRSGEEGNHGNTQDSQVDKGGVDVEDDEEPLRNGDPSPKFGDGATPLSLWVII